MTAEEQLEQLSDNIVKDMTTQEMAVLLIKFKIQHIRNRLEESEIFLAHSKEQTAKMCVLISTERDIDILSVYADRLQGIVEHERDAYCDVASDTVELEEAIECENSMQIKG